MSPAAEVDIPAVRTLEVADSPVVRVQVNRTVAGIGRRTAGCTGCRGRTWLWCCAM